MARIAGVDLPQKKRMEYALTYIFGISLKTSRDILDRTGIDYNTRAHELTDAQAAVIRNDIQENIVVEGDLRKKAKKAYLKSFPYAALMKTTLWILNPRFIKMTHNRLGFGKKLI